MTERDVAAAEDLFRAERARLRRYILAMVRDPAEAEDLAQETLLRAWRAMPALRDGAAVRPWLYRIATNLVLDRARARDRRPTTVPGAPEPAFDELPLRRLEQAEMSGCVNDLVDRLPDGQRAVLLLHDAEGLTNPEIAELLDCSLPAVKIRLHRGRARLRQLVDDACRIGSDDRGTVVCEPAATAPAVRP